VRHGNILLLRHWNNPRVRDLRLSNGLTDTC